MYTCTSDTLSCSDVEVWVSKSETDLQSNKELYHTDKELEKGEECDSDTEVIKLQFYFFLCVHVIYMKLL